LIGVDIEAQRVEGILRSLGMEVFPVDAESCLVTPPSYRPDVENEADLAEEVVRINGLDKIPDIAPKAVAPASFAEDAHAPLEALRDGLIATGLYECVNSSMIDEKLALLDPQFAAEDLLKVANPISLDLAVLRPSLLPGMLATVKRNIARKTPDLALFEAGHVFCANKAKFPEERDECVIALTGRRRPERYSAERGELYDFYDLKGAIEALLSARRLESFSFVAAKDARFVDGACADLLIDGVKAGTLGQAAPALCAGMRLQTPLFIAAIQLDALLKAKTKSRLYEKLSQFPPVARDVAFVAPADLEHSKVVDFILGAKLANLESVQLFDIFADDAMKAAGRKSMAYSLNFRAQDKTLTDEEVNAAHEQLRAKLSKGLGVELR
jgi:phenylalanyl-tRNA synthetase beta chain